MPDLTPAPGSTATSAPSPIIFLTVSGVAATRGSDGSDSAPTAIFMLPLTAPFGRSIWWLTKAARSGKPPGLDQEVGHPGHDEDDDDDPPFHQRQEVQVGLLVGGVVVAVRDRIFRGAVRGHYAILFKLYGSQVLCQFHAGSAAPATG